MHIRNWMALGHDAADGMITWYLAYRLRFNTEMPPANAYNLLGAMLWVAPVLRSAILLDPILPTPFPGSTRLGGAEQSLKCVTIRLPQSHREHEHGQLVA